MTDQICSNASQHVEQKTRPLSSNVTHFKVKSNHETKAISFLEPVELICDLNELETILRQCMSTCFTDVDNAFLFDCMAKCQASKTEGEAKCNGEKGKKLNISP